MHKRFLSGLLLLSSSLSVALAADVVINVRPPKAVVEERGPRPDKEHVWVNGYQRWDGHGYAWEKGRWEKPPHAHASWVAPKYTHHGNGYVFTEGHWR
jgi:hypothetical protein